MASDAAHGSVSNEWDTVLQAPAPPPCDSSCPDALGSSHLLFPTQDPEYQDQSVEQPSEVPSHLTKEDIFRDSYSTDEASEALSDEEGAIRGLSALPVENSITRRVLCARCRYPELAAICRKPGTLILYPGAEAANLEELSLAADHHPHSLIIIDGTWSQAKDIFYRNSLFRLPKQVQLKTTISSQYVIRTQPTNTCLSTLECAAIALSIMEKNAEIQETILRPLQALCSFQLQYGAQIHHSKEHLLKNGQYNKPMPKNKRKLKKMELLVNNVKI
ncbi:tRNA-uridine aminocarboxypropyltransferase 2 isoform X2 [Mixophyes fleayi]|uniref:tRNA-uridine aminocarboxypropyltransferase 2 isoform X2 n=1 Tax=Mixophyes fleayi TaxID=3061075 RepID=UPI003F4E289F